MINLWSILCVVETAFYRLLSSTLYTLYVKQFDLTCKYKNTSYQAHRAGILFPSPPMEKNIENITTAKMYT